MCLQLLLRARVVLPVSKPAIPDGAVLVSGNRIARVGRWRDLSSASRTKAIDLGEVVLLPGLVNAHCHLDYTHMAGQLPPQKSFTDWLKLITSTKAGWSLADYTASWLEGAEMLVRTGTTTVGDIEAVPDLLPQVWGATALRVFSFLEMVGITGRRQPAAVLQEAVDKIESMNARAYRLGLSPHAPYSTLPELLRLSAAAASRRNWPVAIHVAESEAEFEMFTRGRGELFDWLQRSGRDMSDCGRGSPIHHLARCGLLNHRVLAVHVNYLGPGDATRLSEQRANVVHCPRSHAYFDHHPFPLRRLAKARVNICLGTDSLATVLKTRREMIELSLFDEMRALAKDHPSLSPRTILRTATINGAAALGLEGQIGELSSRALADLIAVPFAGKAAGIYEAVLRHTGQVTVSMINGHWAVAPAWVRSPGSSRSARGGKGNLQLNDALEVPNARPAKAGTPNRGAGRAETPNTGNSTD